MRKNNKYTLYFGSVEQSYLDEHFPGLKTAPPNSTRVGFQETVDEDPTVYSTGDLTNRIPCPNHVHRDPSKNESEKERIVRINEHIKLRNLMANHEEGKKRPPITDYVPTTLPINDPHKLRVDHVVYYDNRTGEIAVVFYSSNKEAAVFYDRYYISPATPWMRKTRGDIIRKMVQKQDCIMLVINGEPAHWGNAYSIRNWIARPVDKRVPITHNTWLQYQEPVFAERAYDRPAYLDLPRTAFILSLYSQIK
jgi:hypothetical protein